jgi:hypothetical protein
MEGGHLREEERWRELIERGKGYINKATFVNKIEASKLELLRSNLHDDSIYSHFFNDGTSPCLSTKTWVLSRSTTEDRFVFILQAWT